MRAYLDTDVLIHHLRGDRRAAEWLRSLSAQAGTELWIGAMQRAEIVFFMRPHEEQATFSLLSRFKTEPVNQAIVDSAARIYAQFHPIHGMDVNDALLAATVLRTGGSITTLNVRHFQVPGLTVVKPW